MSDTSSDVFWQSVDSTPRQLFTNLEKERCRVMEEGQKEERREQMKFVFPVKGMFEDLYIVYICKSL